MNLSLVAADRIPGYMPATFLRWLAEQASSHMSIVEIGSWRGRSTRVLCDNTSGNVTAVDTWRGSPGLDGDVTIMAEHYADPDWVFSEFQRNLAGATNLEIIRQPSVVAASLLKREGRTFDMIFIDALHDYESVKADLKAWFPLLRRPGLFCGHDFDYGEVYKAVTEAIPGLTKPPGSEPSGIWAANFLAGPKP